MLERVSHPEHEDGRMQIEDRLLHGNPTNVEAIAQEYNQDCNQHHKKAKPAQTAAHPLREAVDQSDNCLNRISHPNTNRPGDTLL